MEVYVREYIDETVDGDKLQIIEVEPYQYPPSKTEKPKEYDYILQTEY